MNTPILGTGLSGLVGSRIVELLGSDYEFTDLSYATGVDITDYNQVLSSLQSSPAKVVIHMAAKTNVDSCEDDKILVEDGAAWNVNVVGTKNIVDAAKKLGKRILYISTDFVFDGTKDNYIESDKPNPINWYGNTKYEGELAVIRSGVSYAILRLAYPYRSIFVGKLDFVRRIIEKSKKGEKIFALTDHIFTPTFIDDIATAIDVLIQREVNGIFHIVGSQSLSPYEATNIILNKFNLKGDVEKIDRETYFKDRAFRPFKLALKNDRISELGIKMHGLFSGLDEVKKQLSGSL